MRAVVLRGHGDLDSLEYVTDFPDPVVCEGHVVIRVKATSFNYHDVFTVRGMPGIKVPFPMIIGLDLAGEILEIGAGVSGWKPGDRVLVNPLNKKKGLMGEMMHGGLAEKCLVAADQLIRMPDSVTFEQAASLPVAYGTAHRMIITHDTIKRGEKVLVLGASGGVGTGCVLLAKMLGAEVIACASSADKIKRLQDLGADHVINYKETDFSKWAVEKFGKPQRRTYDGGVDVVINFTGGDTWGADAEVRQARRQDPGLRRDRRLRPQGRPALCVELRAEDHRFEQLLRRKPQGPDGPDPAGQDQAGHR